MAPRPSPPVPAASLCGGPLLSLGPASALGWGVPACAVLALCTNKQAAMAREPRLSLDCGSVGGAHMGMPPGTGLRELSPRVSRILLQEAEPHLLLGRDFGGHLELPCMLQEGKLRPLRRESVPIWRLNQGP